MASAACCAAGPPVACDYTPKGTISKIGDVDTYFVGSGPKALVVVYDIFGFSPQLKQVCDMFAAAGFNVAMPDFCKGNPWPLENFPPKDRSELGAWFGTTGKWETSIRPTFIPAVAHMKEHRGAEVVGVTGFCWGGMIAMKAASLDPDAEGGVKAGGTVHPAMLSAELAQDVKVPVLIMPSGEDPDHLPVKEVLDKKPFGDKCQYRRFDDMHHGFCAARGDWANAVQATRAAEAIDAFVKFYTANL
ncbi:conserved unknown protein [Ectocarpus siliculosus]|uniref:Dienelactone hydrolase domain-containing protein n=1 Tax=Ectocarpus siliculosus TaxID=2880 RepID=D7FRF8_ECTSI|nr:conserved unknown protein [Ectocarpus siliculosus]|eukprot:CBJ30749.1 conserved unknown protein [Ectocarpus siliculosus]